MTNPSAGIASFTYDPNGNLLSVQDPSQKGTSLQTTYSYDNMDQVQTRTDPLGRQEFYTHDANGNVTSFTDRRGKVTNFQYDHLGRSVFVGFGATGSPAIYENTTNYTYD